MQRALSPYLWAETDRCCAATTDHRVPGEQCGLGMKRKIKFVFTCSKFFTLQVPTLRTALRHPLLLLISHF